MVCPGEGEVVSDWKGRVQMTEDDSNEVEAYQITQVYLVWMKNNPGLKKNFCDKAHRFAIVNDPCHYWS